MLPYELALFNDDDEYESSSNKQNKKSTYNKEKAIKSKLINSEKNIKRIKKRKNLSQGTKETIKHFNSDKFIIPPERRISIDTSKIKSVKKEFNKERYYGNTEYKLKLCDVTYKRIEELTTQMKFRIEEGKGECFYEVGVEDSGYELGISKEELEKTLSVLDTIAISLGCKTNKIEYFWGKSGGLIAEMHIKRIEDLNKIEINVGVLGEEGTGKSTLIGVLINGVLDNGKGSGRQNVLRHKHEILCGKTSSFTHKILGFDEKGEVMNYGDLLKPSIEQIINKSTKIINFYDMAGSNKTFNRTTLSTLSNEYLDYIFFVISAKKPITKNTEDIFRFIHNLNLPIITIINKIDLINEQDLKAFVSQYKKVIKKLFPDKIPIILKDNYDLALFSSNMDEKEPLLLFLTSTLTWDGGLTHLKNFLGLLPQPDKRRNKDKDKELELEKMEFDIHETICKGNNILLQGIVSSGKLRTNSKCFLGPDIHGNFKTVEIADLHCKWINVNYCFKGQYCSVSIKSIGPTNTLTKDDVNKGMSLLDLRQVPVSSRLFEIELWTIDDTEKSFKSSYQPILNIKHIRQGVRIKNPDELFFFLTNNKKINDLENLLLSDDINFDNVNDKIAQLINKNSFKSKYGFIKNNLITKDNIFPFNEEITVGPSNKKTKLVVEFLFNPQYISIGQKVFINDQSLKACGTITKIFI